MFSVCHNPSIIEDIYNNEVSVARMYKGAAPIIEKLKVASRSDVVPGNLLEALQLYDGDCRKDVLESIAKYDVPSFRVIIPDRVKHIAIPSDMRFMVGLNDGWRGVHIRAQYVDAILTYGDNCKPKIELQVFNKNKRAPKPYDKVKVLEDESLIWGFVK
jgi:hypothetical protein